MAGAADEAELHACCRVESGEHLLMTLGVNDDISEQWHSGCIEGIAGKPCVQNFNGDVLNA